VVLDEPGVVGAEPHPTRGGVALRFRSTGSGAGRQRGLETVDDGEEPRVEVDALVLMFPSPRHKGVDDLLRPRSDVDESRPRDPRLRQLVLCLGDEAREVLDDADDLRLERESSLCVLVAVAVETTTTTTTA